MIDWEVVIRKLTFTIQGDSIWPSTTFTSDQGHWQTKPSKILVRCISFIILNLVLKVWVTGHNSLSERGLAVCNSGGGWGGRYHHSSAHHRAERDLDSWCPACWDMEHESKSPLTTIKIPYSFHVKTLLHSVVELQT